MADHLNKLLLIVACTLAAGTSGCGKSTPAGATGRGLRPPAIAGVLGGGEADQAKLNAYTTVHNDLLGTFGLVETAKSYSEADIAHKAQTDSISITNGGLDGSLAKLKDARAMPGGGANLDGAADRLIADLAKATAHVDALRIYYEAKSYKEDGLTRGKRENAAMAAEFNAAVASLQNFEQVLDRERTRREDAEMAAMKSRGDMLGYDTRLALHQGKGLVGMFKSAADAKNPIVIAKADIAVAALEHTLTTARAEFAKKTAAAKGSSEAPNSEYSSIADSLTSLVGEYRELKQSGDPNHVEQMIYQYDSAISSSNSLQYFSH